ncbi:hypothetical protein [Rhodococcus sp. 14-2470-1a]|uniref:hypothetical protein n=1 Tax=Rhodococcus sp. 14-2470-1a TaxID=2023150 RepID=UPI000B9C6CE2|nr:hypothetical protein [Rhodococcus sp. 14-2470-1a]OZF44269.1 hypothetical protein CH292_24545 [Rhodococcus sp. 14-2470-1a]
MTPPDFTDESLWTHVQGSELHEHRGDWLRFDHEYVHDPVRDRWGRITWMDTEAGVVTVRLADGTEERMGIAPKERCEVIVVPKWRDRPTEADA